MGLTRIGENAFQNSNLRMRTLLPGVRETGAGAFAGFGDFETAIVPQGVKATRGTPFTLCRDLKKRLRY